MVIVSADKDLMQLVGDDVLMWDTMRDKTFGPPEVAERFGVPIEKVRDWLALTGDASDRRRWWHQCRADPAGDQHRLMVQPGHRDRRL